MKLMLSSMGATNASLKAELADLLGKPIEASSALVVPTGMYPFSGGAQGAWGALAGVGVPRGFADLGWKSLGVLELTALPSVKREVWEQSVRDADAILVWGGHVAYLAYWLRQSGLADLLPQLDSVYLGVSAGSIALTPHNQDAPENVATLPEGSPIAADAERGLGLVDFSVSVHLNADSHPDNTLEAAAAWAVTLPVPAYALDNDSAVIVDGDRIEVVSEGEWERFG